MNEPRATLTAPAAQRCCARAFGSAASDLDVALTVVDRASAVTALLVAGMSDRQGRAIGIDEPWTWTLNQRLQALIAMRLASGDATIELQAACSACGEAMALDLDLHALAGDPAAPHFTWHDDDGTEVSLRLPCAHDLQRWQRDGVLAQERLAASLIESIAGQAVGADHHLSARWLAALDEAFAAHDPLTALQLQTRCPACGHDELVACDLEARLLDGFAGTQAKMLEEVLQLASVFHWSEAEILALPRWRRTHYLQQIAARGWA